MTVMPSSADVADKAVSTDDVAEDGDIIGVGVGVGTGVEMARLEAVLAALVETKVEAIKASSTLSKKYGSAPASPHRRRLTSTSTASSSQNHHHHHHHHHRYHHQQQQHEQNRRKSHQPHHHHHHHHHHHQQQHQHHHRQRRHDSAPCGEFIEQPISHRQQKLHGKGRRRASENPRGLKKKRRYSKSPQALEDVAQGIPVGLDSRFELLGIDGEQDLSLINFERTREALSDSSEYPRLHRSACYISDSAAQLKIHYDDDDYVALNVADEFEEDDTLNVPGRLDEAPARYHRPRKKRKRRRRRIDSEVAEEELADPEELPPRARWTIIATACLLLAMSLLLVGVTLRMAPIIDDMGDGRRASVSKKPRTRRGSSARRKDSVRPTRKAVEDAQKVIEEARESEQARRHRRIAMIVLGTFLFLLGASVLVVIVTLTNSSFLSPATGSKELAEHRAQLRKENEELLNSLNRDHSLPGNSTAPP